MKNPIKGDSSVIVWKEVFPEYFGYPIKHGQRTRGVYLIGDFYIGQSGCIEKIIKAHVCNSLQGSNEPCHIKIRELINSGSFIGLKVIHHINDPKKENDLILKYLRKGYPLVNRLTF